MQRPVHTRDQPETLAFVALFRALLDRYPDRMAVAELVTTDDAAATMITYTDGPDRYHTAYSFMLMRENIGGQDIRAALEAMTRDSIQSWPSWAFSNHDVVRAPSRWSLKVGVGDSEPRLVRLLIALVCSLRGTVFLYQGEELGLPQAVVPFDRLQDPEGRTFWPGYPGRDGARTPMPWTADVPNAGFCPGDVEPWLPVDSRQRAMAVERQQQDSHSTLAFTRAFLAWRRQYPALIRGDIRFLDAPTPLLAFEREAGGKRLLCVFNLGGGECRMHASEAGLAADTQTLSVPGALGSVSDGMICLSSLGFMMLECD